MIEVMHPADESEIPLSFALASRGLLPLRPRIGLIVNGKPCAFELLGKIAEELSAHVGRALAVEIVRKPSAAIQLEDAEADRLAATVDVVVCGLGDCGGCSTTSLYDALMLEQRGIPSALVITEPFQSIVASAGARLGSPDYRATVVPHPVFGKSDEELSSLARAAVRAVAAQLTDHADPDPKESR